MGFLALLQVVLNEDPANYRDVRVSINVAVRHGLISHQDGFRLDEVLMNRVRAA